MIRKNPSGHSPQISPKAFVDPTAIICGKVIIEDNVFVGPYAVIRADEVDDSGNMKPIIIKKETNIQDGVVIHSKSGAEVIIGERTSIAHRSIVHGPCEIGDDVFIGFNSVVFRTKVGSGTVIRHNSVIDGIDIPEKINVPPMTNVGPGFEFESLEEVSAIYSTFSESVVGANKALVAGYKNLANEL